MATTSLWQKFTATKTKYCKGNATYKQLRAACKKYIDGAAKKAKVGTKTATRAKASKRAQAVLKKSCKVK